MKKAQMADMFDHIAPRYDFLNSLLSFGIHRSWRKKAIRLLEKENPQSILDIATGTADFAIEALTLHPKKVVGIDISEGMLRLGREKLKKKRLENSIQLLPGDSENLPFDAHSFDAVTVAFGVRNFENLEKGLSAIFGVLKPGGSLVVLEFSTPRNAFVKGIYHFYFHRVTPFVGRLFSKDMAAYTYLPESVSAFPDGDRFVSILQQNGFSGISCYRLTLGIATIYMGKK